MSILIVDDSEDSRTLLGSLLHDLGFEVTATECAAEAFGQLGLQYSGEEASNPEEPCAFDLVLMDIKMPGIDGLEACRRIKEHERLHELPVIFVSGQTDEDSLGAAFSAGGADFILKPVRRADLIARLDAAFRLQRSVRHGRARELELRDVRRRLASAEERLQQQAARAGPSGAQRAPPPARRPRGSRRGRR